MASFKALCLAGVASLAATAAAHAADLLPPPPQFAPPAPYVPVEFGGGWYLRGDVGIGISDLRTQNSTFNSFVPDARFESHSLDDSGFIDAGVGYRFNDFFRADITGEYRASAHYSAIESFNQGFFSKPKTGVRGFDTYSGSFRAVDGLVNGYVDAGTWYGVTPFIGAGVGIANIGVNNVIDVSPGGGFGFASDHSQTNFAFALMAGLDFAVTQNLKIELGYRYLNLGNVSSGAIACQNTTVCPFEVQHFRLASNDIRLGFRYMFADYAPLPQPPLIRKY